MMAITLITLLVLTPIAHAGVVYYYWDYIVYKQGTNIDYAHPDNEYYDISNTEDFTIPGWSIYHNQISKDKTNGIIGASVALCGILGLIITAWLGGGTMAQFVGGITGTVLAGVVYMVIDYYFVDERGCIWWWISKNFVNWLYAHLSDLYLNPDLALGLITYEFLCYCYFRIGQVTFNNPLGIDDPPRPTLTISTTSGGTTNPAPGTYIYIEGSSVTVRAIPNSGYTFDYWFLDGVGQYCNPITVPMDSDHTLQLYFGTTLTIKVPQAPPEGVKVWVDPWKEEEYIAYANAPAIITVTVGEYFPLQVQGGFLKEGGVPGAYYQYVFYKWSDGVSKNPRDMRIYSPTTLTASYLRSGYGIASTQPE